MQKAKIKNKIQQILTVLTVSSLFLFGLATGIYNILGVIETKTIQAKARIINFIMGDVGNYAWTITVPKTKAEIEERTPIEEYYYRFENDNDFRSYITNLKVRRNNPGNLRFANQPGAKNNNGFAEFPNVFLGFRALILQLELYQKKNHTIRTFLERYSPHSENDTEHLISEMGKRLRANENTKINSIDTILLAQDVTRQEHSVVY